MTSPMRTVSPMPGARFVSQATYHQSSLPGIPHLKELCLRAIAANFAKQPSFAGLAPQFVDRVISLLPPTLPLQVAAPLIDDELFWERSSTGRWRNCQPTEHGGSWKRLYMEKHLAEALEQFDFAGTDSQNFDGLLKVCAPHVIHLNIGQVLARVDGRRLLSLLPRLTSLRITYTVRKVGMDFDWAMFGMRLEDAQQLAEGLRETKSLAALIVERCMIDDECTKAIAEGLAQNSTVTMLDMSHNKITDDGARALAKAFRQPKSVMRHVDLSDNQIRSHGARSLGSAVKHSPSIEWFSIRLNRLGDEGAKHLCTALRQSAVLNTLSIAANGITSASVDDVAFMVQHATSLTSLDISCNPLGNDSAKTLREAVDAAPHLQSIDVRQTGIVIDAAVAITSAARERGVPGPKF